MNRGMMIADPIYNFIMKFPFAWKEIGTFVPEPEDVKYVLERMPKNSDLHRTVKRKVDAELGYSIYDKGVYYGYLTRVLAVAVSGVLKEQRGDDYYS